MDMFALAAIGFIYTTTITFLLFNLLLQRKNKHLLFYLVLFVFGIGVSYISLQNHWSPIFKTIVILGGTLILFSGTKPQKIMAVVLIMQLEMLLDFYHGVWEENSILSVESSVMEIVVFAILIVINILRRNKPPLIEYFNKQYILVWLLLTLNFFLMTSVVTSLEFSNQMKGLIAAILLLASGINIYFCYYLEKTRKLFEENLVITKQVEFQENKLAQNKAYLEKNNRLMHDIKKHYLEIEHALSENQLVYVKEYMKGVYKQYFENADAIFTGNQVIDSMFFALKEQCEKEDLELDYEIMIDRKMAMDDQELAVLLGSLFDRAVKAAKAKDKIHVTLKTETQHLLIAIDYPKERLLPNTGISLKKVEQWEDLQIIHRIVEKYRGMYEAKEESERSEIKVLLPLR